MDLAKPSDVRVRTSVAWEFTGADYRLGDKPWRSDGVSPDPTICQVGRGPNKRHLQSRRKPRRWSDEVGHETEVGPPTRQKRESADKPGSVVDNHPSGTHVAVRLERPTRKPLRAAGTSPKARALPYLVLLQVGFAVPPMLPPARCALTAPFHPYLPRAPDRGSRTRHRRFTFCCTVRGLAPPRRYLAPCPVEPGLSSAS